jgi:hypothetical protein
LQKLVYIIFLVFIIYGCSASRKNNTANVDFRSPSYISGSEIGRKNITNNDFFIQKADIKINSEETNTELIASIKYQKEGKYLISIRSKSGLEIARLFLTDDTILANDRIHKKIYYGSVSYMEFKYGISFRSLPVIFGDFIDADSVDLKRIDCREGKGALSDNIEEKAMTVTIDCKERKIINSIIKYESGDSRLEIKYENFKKFEDISYPAVISLVESKTKSDIRIEIKKIVFNTGEQLIFIPGSNYEYIMLK